MYTGPISSSLCISISTGILAIRIHAIYGLNAQIKRYLGAIWLMTSTTSIALLVVQHLRLIRELPPSLLGMPSIRVRIYNSVPLHVANVLSVLDLGICLPTVIPVHYFVVWIPGVSTTQSLF